MEMGIIIANTGLVIALLATYLLTTLRVPERIGNFIIFRVALYLLPGEIFLSTFMLITLGAEDRTALIVFTIICQAVLVTSLLCYLLSLLVRPPGQRLRRGKTGQMAIPAPPSTPPASGVAPPEPDSLEEDAEVDSAVGTAPISATRPKTKARRITKGDDQASAKQRKKTES